MAKCKRYEEGGLTFAEMDKEDRDAAAAAAIADLDARQAAKSAEAAGPSVKKAATRKVQKVSPKPTAPAPEEKPGALRDLYDIFKRAPKLMKKGGTASSGMKKGGKVRGCGCAQRGLTKGKMR